MRPNYESVFDAYIKLSGKWISLANSVSYVAIINTLWKQDPKKDIDGFVEPDPDDPMAEFMMMWQAPFLPNLMNQ